MALINRDQAIAKVRTTLAKIRPPQGMELLSYKRNRGVSIFPGDDGSVTIRERGYLEQELLVANADLGGILKGIVKREFPRSRKIRFYHLAGPEDLDLVRKKI